MANENDPDDPANYVVVDGAPPVAAMSDSAKLDEVRETLRVLVGSIEKLSAFLTAPAKSPSAVDKLAEAIKELTSETKAQGATLSRIAGALDGLEAEPAPTPASALRPHA